MSRLEMIEEEEEEEKINARVSGYMTPEQKLEWDEAVEEQRKAEKRRELSNGEVMLRFLEQGIPWPQGPTRKKRRG